MKKLFLMCALVFWASAAKAQTESPDVPLDHWAYDAFNRLEQAGLVEPPSGVCGGWMNRYDFAVTVARIWQRVQSDIEVREAGRAVPQNPSDSLKVLQQKPELLDAYAQLAKEFAPQLHMFGLGLNEKIQKQLSVLSATPQAATSTQHSPLQIAPPFPDVPKNHWAYAAVESLRKSGVLIGYPGGAFVREH